MIEFESVSLVPPKDCNVILGQSHFIKSAEDIFESLVNSVPGIKFGLGFCEASGPCLVRHEGTDENLRKLAAEKAFEVGAGHIFVTYIQGAYPLNVLNSLKNIPEVCAIYCATANPVEIIVVQTEQGRGIAGVIDGYASKGIEKDSDVKERREFLRKIGYKLGE